MTKVTDPMTNGTIRVTNRNVPTVLLLLLVFLLLGSCWQHLAEKSKELSPPPGSYAELGSYSAHYYRKTPEENPPQAFLVFIEGSGTPCAYTDFYNLQEKLSDQYASVSFDRAGSGWSENTTEARKIEQLTKELHELIEAATPIEASAADMPLILVCHSLGALEAIHYAQTYPEEVEGIIFLDSGSPEFYAEDSETTAKILNLTNAALRTTGILRGLGEMGFLLPVYGEKERYEMLPDEQQAIDKEMYYRYAGNPAVRTYIDEMNENAAAICEGEKLGQLPILVLSSDSGDDWNRVGEELAAWSENSTRIVIPGSKHYLHHTNSEEVIGYIRAFCENID